MIRFSLRCSNGHGFESWFQSNEAYETLGKAGMLTCPSCDCTKIEKSMMTPGLGSSSDGEKEVQPETKPEVRGAGEKTRKSLKEIRKWVEANTEYVGKRFAAEARAIHEGDSPERSIYGEARPADAMDLLQDGIPVLPLPWPNKHNTN